MISCRGASRRRSRSRGRGSRLEFLAYSFRRRALAEGAAGARLKLGVQIFTLPKTSLVFRLGEVLNFSPRGWDDSLQGLLAPPAPISVSTSSLPIRYFSFLAKVEQLWNSFSSSCRGLGAFFQGGERAREWFCREQFCQELQCIGEREGTCSPRLADAAERSISGS